jgi:glycosyltransferase involved in cell wall biosynthesis
MERIRNIHQMQVAAAKENSIGNEVAALQAALREWGFGSRLYAEEISPDFHGAVQHFSRYRPTSGDLVILHYSTGSPLVDYLRSLNVPLVLIYHNVTPATFLTGLGGGEAERARRGRLALAGLREQTILALARSEYSRQELVEIGFDPVRVVPVVVTDVLRHVPPDEETLGRFDGTGDVNLLFVGRIVPNKRQEDLVKLLYVYRQINPNSRLFLVGSWSNSQRYADWLRQLTRRLGLEEAVHLVGHVSNAELAAYYRLAHLFVCMSEHEGFGIPLVEAMRFDLPIVAYASTAIPSTLGGAGILIQQKSFAVVAEVIHLLQTCPAFRGAIIEGQRRRRIAFEAETVLAGLQRVLFETVDGIARSAETDRTPKQ